MQAALHRRVHKIKPLPTPAVLEIPQMSQFWLKSDTLLDDVQEQSRLSQDNVGHKRCV